MIRSLSQFIVRTSQSPPMFLLALLLGMPALFLVLFPIARAFKEVTGGLMPFDWQEHLTVASIYAQLPKYSETARQLYCAHAFVDFIFPVFVAAFFGAIAAFFLRHGLPRLYESATRLGLFALFFISVPFDWTENTASLITIFGYPAEYPAVAQILAWANTVKLLAEPVVPDATAMLVVLGAGGWMMGRFTGRSAAHGAATHD